MELYGHNAAHNAHTMHTQWHRQCCLTFQLPYRNWNDVELFAILVKDDFWELAVKTLKGRL